MKYFTLFTLSLLSTLSFAKADQFNLEEASSTEITLKIKKLADKLSTDNTNPFKKKKNEIKMNALKMINFIKDNNAQSSQIQKYIDTYKRAAEHAVPETSLSRIGLTRVLFLNPTQKNLIPWEVYGFNIPRGLCPIIMQYDPTAPIVYLGIELPPSAREKIPDHIQRFIKEKPIKDLKIAICVQKLNFSPENEKQNLSLKPQCWLHPDAPEKVSTPTNLQNVVFWKTFANTNSSEETDWAKETVSIHPNNKTEMVLSGNVMHIEDRIDRKNPSSFYSLVVTEDMARGVLTYHTLIPLDNPQSDNPLWTSTPTTVAPVFYSFPGGTVIDYITRLKDVKSKSNNSVYKFTNSNSWAFIDEIERLVTLPKSNGHNNNNNNAVQSEQKKTVSTGEQPFLINGTDATTLKPIPSRDDQQTILAKPKTYKLFSLYLKSNKITTADPQKLSELLGTWLQIMETSVSRGLLFE